MINGWSFKKKVLNHVCIIFFDFYKKEREENVDDDAWISTREGEGGGTSPSM